MSVALVVPTNGRRDCIDQSIDLAYAKLAGLSITRLVISDDSGCSKYQAWLAQRWPNAELVTTPAPTGFAPAMRRAQHAAIDGPEPWVFWLEDDFLIPEPVDLDAMADVLTAHPHLTQMVLKRQAWYGNEVAAGGIVEVDPAAYLEVTDDAGNVWLEHQLGHWLNPHLVARSFLAEHRWPTGAWSESRFGRQVLTGDRRSAFWGARTDPPRTIHIGERSGFGY